MENHDWTKFSTKIPIKAECNTILNAWTSQENLEKWFLRLAEFRSSNNSLKERHSTLEKGDTFLWKWHGSNDIEKGEILEYNKKDLLQFTFLNCLVTVTTKIENSENVIEVVQSEIATDETSKMNYYVGCTRGWTFYLANLKSILEGGIDLRNKNMELVDVINT